MIKLTNDFSLNEALAGALLRAAEFMQQRLEDKYQIQLQTEADEVIGEVIPRWPEDEQFRYNSRQLLAFMAQQEDRRGLVVDGAV